MKPTHSAATSESKQATPDADGHSVTAPAPRAPAHAKKLNRGPILIAVVLVIIGLGAFFTWPTIARSLNTVSTDDAYVNGHLTVVAARVPGQVTEVFVDDNVRIRKGETLVLLDKEPYEIQVKLKQAALNTAKADLVAAQDNVRGIVALARSNRFKLQHSIEHVDDQIALLRARVAALSSKEASLARAKADLDRAEKIIASRTISQEELDQRTEAFKTARAAMRQSLEEVYETRVSLGLPAQPGEGKELTDVPKDLNQNFSSVRQALAELMQSIAPLGIFPPSYNATPQEVVADFYKRDPDGDLDRIYAKLIREAAPIQQADAKLNQAQHELDDAQLNLSYCTVTAAIDGVVTRRNVNAGNNVQAGQALMAIRSLTEIWIDANFKETQLERLRIGQPVDVEVDMYGSHRVFEGRISGFTMGTGSTLSLLPPQNATGNFVKIVQRLPVRIELEKYDPDRDTLFFGLSVTPFVRFKEEPAGPNAGKRLQESRPLTGEQ